MMPLQALCRRRPWSASARAPARLISTLSPEQFCGVGPAEVRVVRAQLIVVRAQLRVVSSDARYES
jgi:hypothetical protein